METPYVPPGFRIVTPYLTVKGAEELLAFMKRVFEAEELACHREGGIIVNAAVRIGDSTIELSEATNEWRAMPSALHVYVADCDATHARAVAAGATVLHGPMDQEYGERSSAVRDIAGNNWYIATHIRKPRGT